MNGLSPIDVEYYENQLRQLSDRLQKASNLLLPDAYETEKEQLFQAKGLVDRNITGFNEVLNSCSAGVLFNESRISVEMNMNTSVTNILWSCQDILNNIFMFNDDFNNYVTGLDSLSISQKNLDQFILTEQQFNFIVDDLDECSRIIISVLSKLDGYNI